MKTYQEPYKEEYQRGKGRGLCKIPHTYMPSDQSLAISVDGRFLSRLRDTYFMMPDPSQGWEILNFKFAVLTTVKSGNRPCAATY